MEGRILFSSPPLNEFFKTSNFELNLQTGEVLTYLDPPENIGITCQKKPFDRVPQETHYKANAHRPDARGETQKNPKRKEISGTSRRHAQRWSRIQGTPILSSLDHVCRQLSRTEKKSELSQESAVAACEMYIPYILGPLTSPGINSNQLLGVLVSTIQVPHTCKIVNYF